MIQKSYKNNKATLYLVPTPIGNMDDITLRAIDILKSVDLVLCEDTRDTGLLLNMLDIKNRMEAYHKFNENGKVDSVIKKLESGCNIALVSDRGTPLISDPGNILAKSVIEAGFNVVGLPGANAFVPALIMSGLDINHFLYYGFLSSKVGFLEKELESLKLLEYALVFYESPHRVKKTLEVMLKVLGNRKIIISREITKLNEEVFRGNIREAVSYVNGIKGEMVLVLEGNNVKSDNFELVKEDLSSLLALGVERKKVLKFVSSKYNYSKNDLYRMLEEGEL